MANELPNGYADMPRLDKATHWAGVILRHMRWMGESGKDEMNVFEPRLLSDLVSSDSAIDVLMPAILTCVARMWLEPPAAFLNAVNDRMGTNYPVDEGMAVARFGMKG